MKCQRTSEIRAMSWDEGKQQAWICDLAKICVELYLDEAPKLTPKNSEISPIRMLIDIPKKSIFDLFSFIHISCLSWFLSHDMSCKGIGNSPECCLMGFHPCDQNPIHQVPLLCCILYIYFRCWPIV